jgi:hypothetical protein
MGALCIAPKVRIVIAEVVFRVYAGSVHGERWRILREQVESTFL